MELVSPMTTVMPAKHERNYLMQICVQDAHTDFMGHVNNAQFLHWAQEAALTYWRSNAPPDALENMAWVAVEHVIRYHRPSFTGDDIRLEVGLSKVRGSCAYFSIHFLREKEALATIESTWCCVCTARHRPLRIPAYLIASFADRGLAI